MIIPETFDQVFFKYANQYNVPFTWLKAIAGAESDWKPNAYRDEPQINDGSRGLMQVLLRTARGLGYSGDPGGLFDPDTNVNYGAKLIKELIGRFGRDFQKVYSAYNSGSATAYLTNEQVKKHVERAVRYLQAVENEPGVVYVQGKAENGSQGASSMEMALLIGILGGIALFFTNK